MIPNSQKQFFSAIEDGNVELVLKMLAAEPSLVDLPDEDGYTPLMRAVSSVDRTPELVESLLTAGANVKAATSEGYTALHIMIDVNGPTGHGKIPGRIARLLANAGANLEVCQHWGWTPLMRAAIEGTPDELQALVDVGGQVDQIFPGHALPSFARGLTILMATIGNPKKIEILINAGADVRAVNAQGQTALSYAKQLLADSEIRKAEKKPFNTGGEATALKTAIEGMKKAGIDPDAPMPFEPGGLTYRQSMERSIKQTLEKAAEFDFTGEVQKSIALIEKALSGR